MTPASLGSFTLSGVPGSVQAGQQFPSPGNDITVTAYDVYGNQKTDYTGTVTWSSTDSYPATLPTDNGTGWSNGQKTFSGSSFILYTTPSQTITVTDGAVNQTSSPIIVTPAAINDFSLSIPTGTTQTAGISFSLNVTNAHDQYNNLWSGTVIVSPSTGGGSSPNGISPTFSDIVVTNGTGQANQTLVNAETGVVLQGQAGGVTKTVSGITVNPASLASLKIRDAAGGGGNEVVTHIMKVGESLSLFSAGYDVYGNYRGDENTNWTSQGLIPAVNISNVSHITFTPTTPGNGTITSADPADPNITDHTGTIIVNPGPVTHFGIDPIGTQVVGEPFPITVTAYDSHNNIATGFSGRVNISDLTTTVKPVQSANFLNGVWTGGVTIFQEYTNDRITVTEDGGTSTGTSNQFDVIAAPGIRIINFKPMQGDTLTPLQTVTTDQTVDWFLKMSVENLGSAPVRLDSIRLQFIVNGILRDDYTVSFPDTFLTSRNDTLAGGAIDSLLITVNTTGHDAGSATVQSFLYLSNTQTGSSLSDHALTTLTVQTPAQLVITGVYPSLNEVTRGQDVNWTVSVVVNNVGESDVLVDSTAADTTLSFTIGTGWQIGRPLEFAGGGWFLSGGETDTLIYTVETTGDGEAGVCTINASVTGTEVNTGRSLADNTSDGGWGEVLIENPASLSVFQVENLALNSPYVDTNQNFPIKVTLVNTGGDGIHNVEVNLSSNGSSTFPPLTLLNSIAGGDTESVEIFITASYGINPSEVFTATAEGYADNTNIHLLSSNPIDDTTKAVIQSPASLVVQKVIASRSEVLGGQVDPWTVKVAIQNNGQATLLLDTPTPDDLNFYINNTLQSDYKVEAPTSLKEGGLTLPGGAIDTLVYTVTKTGLLGGSARVQASIRGKDKNTNNLLSDTDSTTVIIQANPSFRIISTHIATLNKTEAGNGYVNTGQEFRVIVFVENGLGETVKDVYITLNNDGGSSIDESTLFIPSLTPSQWDSVEFQVTADTKENLSGETFTATLTRANLESSGNPAPIGPALDSTTIAFIQSPAYLSLSLELSNPSGLFSANQTFTLKVLLNNYGTGEVDTSGRISITLPQNYTLDIMNSPTDTLGITTNSPVQWSIKAPAESQSKQPIYVTLYRLPKEKNTGNPAKVERQTVNVDVTTIKSSLTTTVHISSPPGAVDGGVSSGQVFVVETTVQSNNVKDVTATLSLPYGYTTADNLTKSVNSDNVYWQVKAPDVAMATSIIQVSSQGYDALQDNVVVEGNNGNPAQVYVTTVLRADLALNLSTPDNSLSLGQEFEVRALVENKGQADTVGVTRVALDPLPDGYTTTDPLVKNLVNGQASWTIKAPVTPTREAVNIAANLVTVPLDKNTSQEAYVSKGNDKVAVTTVGAWLSVFKCSKPDTVNGLVSPGEKGVWLDGLGLINRGEKGANGIVIHSLTFYVEDFEGNDISPKDIFSEIRTVKMICNRDTTYIDTTHIFGKISQDLIPDENPFTITFDFPDTIMATDTSYIVILGDVSNIPQVSTVQLNLASGKDINATDQYSPSVSISVLDVLGNEFENMRSDPKRIIQKQEIADDAKPYLFNCPNPFGESGKEITTVIYYLKEDTEVLFKIYTLTGELVFSKSFTASEPQGRKGVHSTPSNSFTWDGKNDMGRRVLNGIYILVMKTGYGEVAKSKIALVR